MPEPIVIVDDDPLWPHKFERARFSGALPGLAVSIEHIGSTAVPGLSAKPIIDILAGVHSRNEFNECTRILKSIGYMYEPYPQFPERRFFRDGTIGAGPHHLHLTEVASDFWRDKVTFRDWLRTHPEDAHEYLVLKQDLARTFGADREKYERYTEGKSEFISSVLANAREI